MLKSLKKLYLIYNTRDESSMTKMDNRHSVAAADFVAKQSSMVKFTLDECRRIQRIWSQAQCQSSQFEQELGEHIITTLTEDRPELLRSFGDDQQSVEQRAQLAATKIGQFFDRLIRSLTDDNNHLFTKEETITKTTKLSERINPKLTTPNEARNPIDQLMNRVVATHLSMGVNLTTDSFRRLKQVLVRDVFNMNEEVFRDQLACGVRADLLVWNRFMCFVVMKLKASVENQRINSDFL